MSKLFNDFMRFNTCYCINQYLGVIYPKEEFEQIDTLIILLCYDRKTMATYLLIWKVLKHLVKSAKARNKGSNV